MTQDVQRSSTQLQIRYNGKRIVADFPADSCADVNKTVEQFMHTHHVPIHLHHSVRPLRICTVQSRRIVRKLRRSRRPSFSSKNLRRKHTVTMLKAAPRRTLR